MNKPDKEFIIRSFTQAHINTLTCLPIYTFGQDCSASGPLLKLSTVWQRLIAVYSSVKKKNLIYPLDHMKLKVGWPSLHRLTLSGVI